MSGNIKGSHICNKAWEKSFIQKHSFWENRALVQKHSFQEIRNGNLAWFWEDNQQQEGNLSREELYRIQTDAINTGLKKVSDYWDQSGENCKWRIWKLREYNEATPLKTQAKSLEIIVEKRQILSSTSDDLLRQGRNNEGVFNLKEDKRIAMGLNLPITNKTWKDIWNNPHWKKIKMFR